MNKKRITVIFSLFCFSLFLSCSLFDCPFSFSIDHGATNSAYVAGQQSVTVYYSLSNPGLTILTDVTITIEVDDNDGNSFSETIPEKMLLAGDLYIGSQTISISSAGYDLSSARVTAWDCSDY